MKFVLLVAAFGLVSAQQSQNSQVINLEPNQGPVQIRLQFENSNDGQQQPTIQVQQQQQSSCATGNCGQQNYQEQQQTSCSTGTCGQQTYQQSPCSTGTCGNSVQSSDTTSANIVIKATASEVTQSPCSTGNCGNSYTTTQTIPKFKIIRASSPCYGNRCGPRFFYPRRRFFMPPPCNGCNRPRFFLSNSNNNGNSFGMPDRIFKDGRVFNPRIRIPSSYADGNPVFNVGK